MRKGWLELSWGHRARCLASTETYSWPLASQSQLQGDGAGTQGWEQEGQRGGPKGSLRSEISLCPHGSEAGETA